MMKEETSPEIITTPEKDYIAVYDKKMLWRANLYIDEGAGDWNNVHPWNTDDKNIGWYGENEWLGEGDKQGMQVVSPESTKWCYGYDNKSQHVITKAVAYDHQGWDSPFSFNEKMESQKQILNQWYTVNGEKFDKPVYEWPDKCTDIASYKKYLGEKICGSETDLEKLEELYNSYRNNSTKRWRGELDSLDYSKYIFSKNYGDKTKVPYKDYENFRASFISDVTKNIGNVTGGNEDAVSIGGKACYPYVPGLSDSLMTTLSDYPSSEIGKITAGVDCIGFVQRSAAYGTSETTIYSALKNSNYFFEPPTWGNNTVPAKTATSSPSARDRFHGNSWAVKLTDINHPDDTEKVKNNAGQDEEINLYDKFKYAVPGDIVWYDGHIMMISQIKEPSGKNGMYKMEDVSILESVYNNGFEDGSYKIYGVGNKRDLDVLKRKNKIWEIWRQK